MNTNEVVELSELDLEPVASGKAWGLIQVKVGGQGT